MQGAVRKELRSWINAPAPAQSFANLAITVPDVAEVRVQLEMMKVVDGQHRFLEDDRKIPAQILADSRFRDRIKVDSKGNAVFPHWNLDGACGYEIKNRAFTGFSNDGKKGLWRSKTETDDNRLVITESAIDALSYAAIHPNDRTRYVSTSGQPSPDQRTLIKRKFEKLPAGTEVLLALDNDEGGVNIARIIENLFEVVGRSDITIKRHFPIQCKDWNGVLKVRCDGT